VTDDWLYEYVCCKAWPCDPRMGVGRCGICGQRPTRTGRKWSERESK
jgi:hypothetical protein